MNLLFSLFISFAGLAQPKPEAQERLYLVCASIGASAYVGIGVAACTDASGNIYYTGGEGVGLAVGIGATGYLLIYDGPPGEIRGTYYGGEFAAPLMGAFPNMLGPKVAYFRTSDATRSVTLVGGSLGPKIDAGVGVFHVM